MNNEKYLKVFNDLLLNDKVDDDFKSILYGLVLEKYEEKEQKRKIEKMLRKIK